MAEKIKGAKILLEALKKEGVDTIFGYPGGVLLDIYDEIYKQKDIKHYLVRHEQGAAHAADGYARATGKVGVCLATSGPGATNLVTGIANAHMDSIPMVALTGQVTTSAIGKDSFQEADITGITLPITKHNYLVKDVNDLAHVIKEAFYIAKTGRPGPVLIDLPKDITVNKTVPHYPDKVEIPSYKPTFKGNKRQISAAADLIAKAKRPIILAGGGIILSNAATELRELVKKTSIPVASTLLGIGTYPEDDALALGMVGMHGAAYANYALAGSDLIIAIGMRFSDRVTGKLSEFAQHAKVIHIDIDPAEIGKCVPVTIPIVGDVKQVLKELNPIVKAPGDIKPWLAQVKKWKTEYPLSYIKKTDKVYPQFVVQEINRLTKGDAIITTEVGENQMWAAQFIQHKNPRHFISSGGLGTMGFGFPAAVGAQVGCPDKLVIDIAGDGSFQMNEQELGTILSYNLPVKIVILNNGYLGMVRQWQELFYGKRYSATDLNSGNPDFVKLAEAYGILGLRATTHDEVAKVLEKGFKHKGPVLMDFIVEPEANVFPMVPAGGVIDKMILDEEKDGENYS
ncbi:MAG: biosynthetic-type acetolactate synthase large subunit [Candidatus Margulisiibacteriota bacterium]